MMVRPALALLALASALASLPSDAGGASLTGRSPYILVRFADGASPSLRAADVREAGGTVVGKVYGLPVTVVRVPAGADPAGVAARYRVLRGVAFAETNGIVHAADTATPNDPSFTKQWGLNNTGQTVNGVAGTADADIDAPEGWSVGGFGSFAASPGTPIGIVDTGIATGHPEFVGRIAACANTAPYVGLGQINVGTCSDDNFHGTHVAGIAAAAANNGIGVAGVAFDAPLYICKALDSSGNGDEADAAACVTWLHDQGAKVINMSFADLTDSQTEHDAITQAWDGGSGSVLVAAAGNDYPSAACDYPACYDEVVSVAATDQDDGHATFSNCNAEVELAAPGVNIYSTTPGPSYAFESGTSGAAPFVAGAAALLWQDHPSDTAQQVRDALDAAVDVLPGVDPTCQGHGRLNLQALLGASPPPDTVIDAHPSNPTTSKSATFAFNSVPDGATFECSLGTAAFSSCSSPTTYTGLSQGAHTFAVRSSTSDALDPTPATFTWSVKSILITRITYKASTLDGEWIRLKNFAGSGVAIGGWTIHDGQGNTYTFGPFTLAAGASVTVHTGKGTNTTTDRYWGRSVQVWGDVQDTATVKRANGTVADTCHYDNANASYVLC